MQTLWFILVAVMLAAYVLLDGFDIGVGVVHLLAGRTNQERRLILHSIGPVWDGNEVWLLAAGGTLYFAFPLLYASSFSGFYLPLMMVLWLLMLRAISIEFRAHLHEPVWQNFFDGVFFLSSTLLAIFYGAALGNVIRGVPLGKDGYFFEALWTNWRVGAHPGILDWYTVITGLVALVALANHGAIYLAIKTEAELQKRVSRIALWAWPLLLVLTLVSLVETIRIRPQIDDNYYVHPTGLIIPILVFASIALMLHSLMAGKWKYAFACSTVYIGGMLVGAAFGLYPNVLPASTDPSYSLTIYNTAAASYGLRVGLIWWCVGMVLALGYSVFIYRMFRGKVRLDAGEEGY